MKGADISGISEGFFAVDLSPSVGGPGFTVGYVADDPRAVTLWLGGGSSIGPGDLLGIPQMRVLLSITYAPGPEEEPLDL